MASTQKGSELFEMKLGDAQLLTKVRLQQAVREGQQMRVAWFGPPGGGKTESMLSMPKMAGIDDMEVLYVNCATREYIDFAGLPGFVDGEAVFAPYAFLRKMIDATTPLLVIFDEAPNTDEMGQKALQTIVNEGRIGDHKVSDQCHFVLLGNRRSDKAGVQGMLTSLIDRMDFIVHVAYDNKAWLDYEMRRGKVHPMVLAFAAYKKGAQFSFEAEELERCCTKRSLSRLGELWHEPELRKLPVTVGCIGAEEGTNFHSFVEVEHKLPKREDLERDPEGTPIDENPNLQYILAFLLGQTPLDSPVAHAKVVCRLSPDIAAMNWKLAVKQDPRIGRTTQFRDWQLEHGGSQI